MSGVHVLHVDLDHPGWLLREHCVVPELTFTLTRETGSRFRPPLKPKFRSF